MLSDVDSGVLVWPHRLGFQSGPSCVQAIPRSLRLPDRICKIFGYHFTWSPLLRGGMPMSTATGHDSHSDREAARAFCPAYLLRSNSFDDIGAHLLQFIGNLMFSCWVSSKAMSATSWQKMPYPDTPCCLPQSTRHGNSGESSGRLSFCPAQQCGIWRASEQQHFMHCDVQ